MNNKEENLILVPFLVKDAEEKTTSTNKFYQNVKLISKDKKVIDAKVWHLNFKELLIPNKVVLITGKLGDYKGQAQIVIEEVQPGNNELFDQFIEVAPVDSHVLKDQFLTYVNSIKDPDLKLIVNTIVKRRLGKIELYPAAKAVHHDYKYGLLHHTVSMAKLADFIASQYPEVSRDLLMAGVLLHDVMKTEELSAVSNPEYTLEGKLIGHVSMGAFEVRDLAQELHITGETPILLTHMLLSHHGELEFGSPVLPQTLEALLLSLIDLLDSKAVIAIKALKEVEPGESTSRIFSLDNRSLYKALKKD